jgi:hypothetical protein
MQRRAWPHWPCALGCSTGKTSLCKALAQKLSIRLAHRFRTHCTALRTADRKDNRCLCG